MSEVSFKQMLEEETINSVHNGDVVEGTVVEVKPDMIIMNINCKYEGIIERKEYTANPEADLTTMVQEGDKITAKVMRVNEQIGYVLMTYRKLAQEKIYLELEKHYEDKDVLEGVVTQVRVGGLVVDYKGVHVFVPASLVSDRYEKDLSKYQGQEIRFVVTECNPRRRRIIGNRRMILNEERAKMEAEALERLEEKTRVQGTVKNLTKFGAFVDLGGIDGLLHISEMGWGRVRTPKDYVQVGDEIEVLIKGIDGNRVSLTTKFPEDDPWANLNEKYPINSEVRGTVARLTDFGAFVELEPGVDALLHVSQISRERIEKPEDVLNIGEEIEALIIDNNAIEKKISLSIRELEFRRRRFAMEQGEEPEPMMEEAPETDEVQDDIVEEAAAPAMEEASEE
ncbi:MAG: 30S ribosomal protein S1 [Eubacteriales bacterium]|nr:30S ribosomal protein S1 [Eubacteriales bacterium]